MSDDSLSDDPLARPMRQAPRARSSPEDDSDDAREYRRPQPLEMIRTRNGSTDSGPTARQVVAARLRGDWDAAEAGEGVNIRGQGRIAAERERRAVLIPTRGGGDAGRRAGPSGARPRPTPDGDEERAGNSATGGVPRVILRAPRRGAVEEGEGSAEYGASATARRSREIASERNFMAGLGPIAPRQWAPRPRPAPQHILAASDSDDEPQLPIRERVRRRLRGDNDDQPAAGAVQAAVRRRLNGGTASPAGPSSSNRGGPAARPVAGAGPTSARGRNPARREPVVDLTADSEEEDVVLVAERVPRSRAAPRVGGPMPPPGGEIGGLPLLGTAAGRRRAVQMQQDLQDIEAALAIRREAARALIREERRNAQRVLSPPPAPIPRIGLGGAILQRGDHQIRYRALGDGQAGAPVDIERRMARVARAAPERPAMPVLPPVAQGFGAHALAAMQRAGLELGGWFFGANEALDDPAIMQELLRHGRGGHRHHHAAAAAHVPPPDIPAILAAIDRPNPLVPLPGFTNNFDLDSAGPIVINDHGDVVKPKKKPGLVCFICHCRLRLSASYRSEDDRVWALRCGHMLDQRCLVKLSTPTTPKEIDSIQPPLNVLPVLGSVEKKGKKKTKEKVPKEMPREYEWKCPAEGCGKAHRSVKMPGTEDWVQVAGSGAFQVFM